LRAIPLPNSRPLLIEKNPIGAAGRAAVSVGWSRTHNEGDYAVRIGKPAESDQKECLFRGVRPIAGNEEDRPRVRGGVTGTGPAP